MAAEIKMHLAPSPSLLPVRAAGAHPEKTKRPFRGFTVFLMAGIWAEDFLQKAEYSPEKEYSRHYVNKNACVKSGKKPVSGFADFCVSSKNALQLQGFPACGKLGGNCG